MKRQRRIWLAAAIGMAVYASMSQAEMSILDDFSADSSGKYVAVRTYSSGTATYARNAANQFEPTWAGEATYVWYWNEGQKLRVGESVSVAKCIRDPRSRHPLCHCQESGSQKKRVASHSV